MPRSNDTNYCSWLYSHHILALHVVGLAFILVVCLCHTSRRRLSRPDIEGAMSGSIASETSTPEKTGTEKEPIAETPPDPFSEIQFTQLVPITSGLLAARIDNDTDATAGVMSNQQKPENDRQTTQDHAASTASVPHEQDSSRRYSHPSEEEALVSSPLRETSLYDQTELFLDHEDQGTFWRRRTLVFGSQP
jgi:hypothetical protein